MISMSAAGTSHSYRRFAQNPASEEMGMDMPNYVRNYHANAHRVGEFFAALEARATAAITSLEPAPEPAALTSYLTEEALRLSRFGARQSRMQAALQSIHSRVVGKLDRSNAKKRASAVFFTIAAAASAGWAAVTAGQDHKGPAAAAAAASILSAAMGKWIDSVMKRTERGMKRQREIVRCMIMGGRFTIRNLTEIYALARELKSEAEALPEMADVVAMKERFEELQRKAVQGGSDAGSSRDAVVESILRNSDLALTRQ